MNNTLAPKVFSEGYCCMHGYLRLCKARGEKIKDMAEYISVSASTLDHNYRMFNKGERSCKNYSDCMKPIIEEIEREKGVTFPEKPLEPPAR
jgi:hypothetical protein